MIIFTHLIIGKKKSRSSASSSSGHISTVEMEVIVESLQNQSHRDSTQANYHGIWKAFNKFYIQLDRKPKLWDDRITLYVAYLIDTNHRSATIKSYVSAIRAVLKNLGVRLVKDNAVLASLLRAC